MQKEEKGRCALAPGQRVYSHCSGCSSWSSIPQSSSITGFSTSDCLMSYPGHLFFNFFGKGGSYPFAEMQSVYSTDWADVC